MLRIVVITTGNNYANFVWFVRYDGGYGGLNYASSSYGIRPAFTLPGTLGLAQNPDGTYTLAA